MLPPIDRVDAACSAHDLCYQRFSIKWYIPRSRQCHKREFDQIFYNDLGRAYRSPGLSSEARDYALKAREHFKSTLDAPSDYETYCCP